MPPQIIPTAEPFFFPGNRTGCLLVHGFTGAPKEMRPMGEYLNAQGYSVLGVRLFGHATAIADMKRARWRDWVACVEDGWHMLADSTDQIFIMGLSMGAALSLYAASLFPAAGIVAMAAPYDTPVEGLERALLPVGKYYALLNPYRAKGPENWFNPERQPGHICYDRDPVRGGVEVDGLLGAMRAGLPKITAPVLLVHSRNDLAVPPEHMQLIYDDLTVSDKQMLWVEHASHPITVDGDRQRVFNAAADFVGRVSAASA
ncbi:MAG: alpha/beta fold hydrolase [Anaerolineales bacterium]|nr:alpha/beta fold hydrolase [Anaerolineales bacterium]